jgi:hypothetical protein
MSSEMSSDPKSRDPNSGGRQNVDVEQDTGKDERRPGRDGGTGRTVGPEDEDRRLRPGERSPTDSRP